MSKTLTRTLQAGAACCVSLLIIGQTSSSDAKLTTVAKQEART